MVDEIRSFRRGLLSNIISVDSILSSFFTVQGEVRVVGAFEGLENNGELLEIVGVWGDLW